MVLDSVLESDQSSNTYTASKRSHISEVTVKINLHNFQEKFIVSPKVLIINWVLTIWIGKSVNLCLSYYYTSSDVQNLTNMGQYLMITTHRHKLLNQFCCSQLLFTERSIMMIDAAKHKTSDWTEFTFYWKVQYSTY